MFYTDALIAEMAVALRAVLHRWGLASSAPLRLLTVSENATWVAGEAASARVLRVQRPGYNTDAAIASELVWIAALRAAGVVATPAPIPAGDGEATVPITCGGMRFLVAGFEYVEGHAPSEQGDLARWFAHLGEITARLHQFSRAWTRPEGFERRYWDFRAICGPASDWGDWRAQPGLDDEAIALLSQVEADLAARVAVYDADPRRRGLIHCDMRTANLLVDGDRMSVIDFDDCGIGWFAFDFAASTSFMDPAAIWPLLPHWIAGYERVAPFAEADRAILPTFVMLRRLQLVGWIASHSEAAEPQAIGPDFTRHTVEMGRDWLEKTRP
ncbi:MAG TPA: phosphotransferase [Paenirhodobacter sp.]